MKQKKIYLEAIRIFAIFFVIYTHTGKEAVEHFQVTQNSLSYIISLVLYAFTVTCVPLFLLVSGAVLLHKEESLKYVLLHRALRIFLVIIIFGFIQYTYSYFLNPQIGFDFPTIMKAIYSTTVITQYWYIYAYFALMLMLPFVRMIAKSMNIYHFAYLLGLFFILEGILPITDSLFDSKPIAISIPLLTNTIFYPLMGYFIVHRSEELFYKKKVLILSNLIGLCALFTNTIVALRSHRHWGIGASLDGMTAVIAIVTFINFRATFNAISNSTHQICNSKLKKILCKIILFISNGTFVIYLLELPLRVTFKPIYTALVHYITWLPATVLWIVAAIIAGSLISYILKKIPLLNKLI